MNDLAPSTRLRTPPESCGDFDMRIAADGTWYHQGDPIRRPALVKLFASVLSRDESGTYWLVTPVERGRIIVDDAPFVAVEMTVSGMGSTQILSFRTNLDDRVDADENHPIRVVTDAETLEPRPYILIRPGLEARIARSAFYDLVELCTEELCEGWRRSGVWSSGQFFPLDSSTAPI